MKNISTNIFFFLSPPKKSSNYNTLLFKNKICHKSFCLFVNKNLSNYILQWFSKTKIYYENFCFFLHPKNHQTKIHYLWFEKYVLKSFHFCCIKNYVLNPFFFSCQIVITNYFLKIDKIFGYSKPKTYSNYNTVFFSKENVSIKKLKIILAHLDLKDCWIFHPIQLIQKVS